MGQRVLVVEDEVAIPEAVAPRLRSEGYEVDPAHDGPSGIEMCARRQPDLVVLDVMLPGADGFHVVRRIQWDRARLAQVARDRMPPAQNEAPRRTAEFLDERCD
jgi:DNA-binding response OmpR family regulator